MISPVVVKLTVSDLQQTGNVVGKIYAFSTLGSIVGTFATGFFLIEWMGTRMLVFATAAVLLVCAPLFGGLFRRQKLLLGVYAVATLLFLAGAAFTQPGWYGLYAQVFKLPSSQEGCLVSRESKYYTITVHEEKRSDGKGKQRSLILDSLRHATCDPDDPAYLYYEYLRYYEEVVRWQAARKGGRFNALFLGGGGYNFPRLVEVNYPQAQLHVVEIDPAVTRTVYDFLGLDEHKTRIRTFNEDARWFVMN